MEGTQEAVLELSPWNARAVMLVDLDAFFASVEQHDHPDWKGKPVIVGGSPTKRGVVSTASYEARRFGVHSAMPSSTAARLCPEAIWVSGNFHRYKEVSNQVMAILNDETPFMQQVSIDEAFLDVSPTPTNPEHPVRIAERIKRRVRELGISCSIGLGISKSVAKIASDADKPDGLTVIYPGSEQAYLAPLPLSCMSGIGSVAEAKLKNLGISTLGELAAADRDVAESVFGKNGLEMQLRCMGRDTSPVVQDDTVKSVSSEMSFAESLATRHEIDQAIATMASKTCRRLRKKGLKASTLTLKLRYESLNIRTAQMQPATPTDDEFLVTRELSKLVPSLWTQGMLVRLVGVAASGFDPERQLAAQASLFDPEEDDAPQDTGVRDRHSELIAATDRIRDKYGERAVNFGRENAMLDATTGSGAKNPEDYR